MMILRLTLFKLLILLISANIVFAACGASGSDAEIAASQQRTLAATVAAGTGGDTIVRLAATNAALEAATLVPTTALTTPIIGATTAPVVPKNVTTAPTLIGVTDTPLPATVTVIPTNVPSAVTQVESAVTLAASQSTAVATPTAPASPVPTSPVPASPVPASPPPPTTVPTLVAPTAAQPMPTAPALPADKNPQPLAFADLYSGASIEGPILSDRTKSLNGRQIVMRGYMAPPLKPDLDFFVLTKDPMVYCPFCSTATDWPFDIVFVRMASGTVPPITPTHGVRVIGTFQTGTATDAATGFVSQIRIIADSVETTE